MAQEISSSEDEAFPPYSYPDPEDYYPDYESEDAMEASMQYIREHPEEFPPDHFPLDISGKLRFLKFTKTLTKLRKAPAPKKAVDSSSSAAKAKPKATGSATINGATSTKAAAAKTAAQPKVELANGKAGSTSTSTNGISKKPADKATPVKKAATSSSTPVSAATAAAVPSQPAANRASARSLRTDGANGMSQVDFDRLLSSMGGSIGGGGRGGRAPTSANGQNPGARRRQHNHKSPYLFIHPEDDLAGMSRRYLSDPDKFIPRKQQDYSEEKNFVNWGIGFADGDDGNTLDIGFVMRRMNTQCLYSGDPGIPESQFIKKCRLSYTFVRIIVANHNRLMAKKVAKLNELAFKGPYPDLILRIYMPRIKAEDGTDLIWRQIRLSSGMKIGTFVDKIAMPVMGYVRNHHFSLVTDLSDGAQFGQEDSGCIDRMHMYMHGHEYIPDHQFALGHILRKTGDRIAWLYDLGDVNYHFIVLEQILPPEQSSGKVVILGGRGACPGEDLKGNNGWIQKLEKLRNGTRTERRDVIIEIAQSLNYQKIAAQPGWQFDPLEFNIATTTKRMHAALKSRISDPASAKVFMTPVSLGGSSRTRHTVNPGHGGKPSTDRDPPDQALCAECGKPDDLSRCGRCEAVYYCGTECQHKAWKNHRLRCKAQAGQKDNT